VNKKLNIEFIEGKLAELGLTQTSVSKILDVKRQAVSLWIKGKTFPSPDKLIKLALILKAKYNDLVITEEDLFKPIVAFRLTANRKKTSNDIENAIDMGYALEDLEEYLEFNKYEMPPILIEPKNDYEYISKIVKEIRIKNNIVGGEISVKDLSNIYKKYYATIIPVQWGKKSEHENALHIHLPRRKTTWVYVNMDTSIYNLKFWLAHELGHILTPTLLGEKGEEFAEKFAEEMLLPNDLTADLYEKISSINDYNERVKALERIANILVISPYTITQKLKRFANNTGQDIFSFDNSIGRLINKYNNKKTIVEERIGKKKLNVKELYSFTKELLGSNFYELLAKRIDNEKFETAYVQRLLRINIFEAKDIYNYLFGIKS